MEPEELSPTPDQMGVETKEQQIKTTDEFLDRISDEEIDSGTYSGNINYHIKIGRSLKDVKIENGKALFEVPINLFMQNEDIYRQDDSMILICEIDLSNNSILITGKQDDGGKPYNGALDEWHESATQFIKSHFSGKPKTRRDLEMDRYLRG